MAKQKSDTQESPTSGNVLFIKDYQYLLIANYVEPTTVIKSLFI
jgi:hypothetical protein